MCISQAGGNEEDFCVGTALETDKQGEKNAVTALGLELKRQAWGWARYLGNQSQGAC